MLALIASVILATTSPAAQPNLVGDIPVTIKPGTNVVENLPVTEAYQPTLGSFAEAKPGDIVAWKDEEIIPEPSRSMSELRILKDPSFFTEYSAIRSTRRAVQWFHSGV